MGPPGNSKRGPGRLFRLGVHPEGAGPPSAAAHPMIGGRTWVHHLPPKLVLELPQQSCCFVLFCGLLSYDLQCQVGAWGGEGGRHWASTRSGQPTCRAHRRLVHLPRAVSPAAVGARHWRFRSAHYPGVGEPRCPSAQPPTGSKAAPPTSAAPPHHPRQPPFHLAQK